MTKKEVQQKMQEKLQAINTLCKQLEIVIEAGQKLDNSGFIRNVVTYTDIEKYDIQEEIHQEGLPTLDKVKEEENAN